MTPLLIEKGYAVKVFDFIDADHSDAFNPFPYLRDDKDAMRPVNNLIKNTMPKNPTSNDPFWEKSEIALNTVLILYLLHEAPPEERNLEMVMYMIENGGARESDDGFQSPLSMLFEALEEEEPGHVAAWEYKIFKQAAGKTAKSILLSAAVRLSTFILPRATRIISRDDMELGLMEERKQTVFTIIPDNDGTFNYLVGMPYTCAFQTLYYQADKVHQGALPAPVRLMMDEFCNVSLPDDPGKLQATMRSRNVMSTIVLQNISTLKALFKDDWEGLLGNADTLVYLGGSEPSTHKYISELLGKETLDTRNRSVPRGSHGSSSVSYQQTGRELMTPDEVRTLDNDYALLFIRGERPVMDKRYDVLKHPYIRLTEDDGAAPYVHHPGLIYIQADLSVPSESLDYIEILEQERLIFMSNKKHPQPNALSQRRAGRGRRLYFSAVLMLALCAALACPALAADANPPTIVNNLSDFIFSCIKAVGMIVLGWGVVQLGMPIQSHDASQHAQGILCVLGGLLVTFSKEVLSAIGVV